MFRGCYNLNGIEVDAANRFYDSRSGCNGIVRKSDSALIATCRMTKICEGIQVLGDNCFCGTIISSVTLPKSVVVISYEAFRHCYGIDALDVETGNMSYMSPQGSNAILTKDGKTLVLGCCNTIIPDGVREIGEYAFCGRYNSPILRFPDGLRTIRGSAFINCNMSGIHIPDSVTFIGPNAFEGCQYLTVVKMSSSSLESIQSGTFSGCGNLSIVQLPEGLKSIGKHAFKDCGSLKNVYIPSSATVAVRHIVTDLPAVVGKRLGASLGFACQLEGACLECLDEQVSTLIAAVDIVIGGSLPVEEVAPASAIYRDVNVPLADSLVEKRTPVLRRQRELDAVFVNHHSRIV